MSSCWPLVLRSSRYGLKASLLVAATDVELMIAPASSGGSRNTWTPVLSATGCIPKCWAAETSSAMRRGTRLRAAGMCTTGKGVSVARAYGAALP
eukprot:12924307-Prorocentrum_lima.AAC.1